MLPIGLLAYSANSLSTNSSLADVSMLAGSMSYEDTTLSLLVKY